MKNEKAFAMIIFVVITAVFVGALSMTGIWGTFKIRDIQSIIKINQNDNTSSQNSAEKSPFDVNDNEGTDGVRDGAGNKKADPTMATALSDDMLAEQTMAQSSSGGILVEQSSRRVLKDEGMRNRRYPASTTKVLTALTVLKRMKPDTVVEVPKEAVGVEGSSIYLKAGQKLSVEDLLYGLMLRSGNDAAVALAISTAGSVEDFARLMNEDAAQAGATDSNFVNPHGLHDDNHYTTAYDMAMIACAAYDIEAFRRIVCTKVQRIDVDGAPVAIANKNKLLRQYEGANGVKTGYTKKSGRCLVGGAKREGMQLISVVLNCPDMWNETVRLLNYGFDNFKMAPLDAAFANFQEGARAVKVNVPAPVTSNWRSLRYPILKDGSEYLQIQAA